MLSIQCDKLRERAKELRNLAQDPSVPYLVPSTKETMALAMTSAASEMESAADTIWELRENVHRERAEADTLRELVRDMWLQLLNAYDYKEVDEFADRMRELGVEVDG